MNPAALKANVAGAASAARRSSSTRTPSPCAASRRPATRTNPLEDGSLEAFDVKRVPMTLAHAARRRGDGGRHHAATPRRPRTSSRSACCAGSTTGRPSVTERWIEAKFATKPHVHGGQPRRLPRRLELRRDVRADRHADARRAGDGRRAGHVPQRQRHAGDGARPRRRVDPVRAAAAARRLPDHPGLRAAARAAAATRSSACARSRPRTRSPPPRSRSAPRSAARSA